MKCAYCGKKCKPETRFCTYCGRSVQEHPPRKKAAGGGMVSVLSLSLVLAIVVTGGVWMMVSEWDASLKTVTASDLSQGSADNGETQANGTLTGNWKCVDPSVSANDRPVYGTEVSVRLTLNPNGTFLLDYTQFQAGVKAVALTHQGTYEAQKGQIRFFPVSPDSRSPFVQKYGTTPEFRFQVSSRKLKLRLDTDTSVVFRRMD